jgi:tRNA(fMet)-specific endonuclease VapC
MYLLDTDHITLLDRGGQEGSAIRTRLLQASQEVIAASIISYEEQLRGWLARIARFRRIDQQATGYHELGRMLEFYCDTPLLPFDDTAVERFQRLWAARLRIGTMDLKIAAIALANDATLLSRNLSDFGKVPGLRVEDWSN